MSRDVIWSDIAESDGQKERDNRVKEDKDDEDDDDESARSVSVVVQ